MHLFTYGTLMEADVWTRVAREECASVPAVLHGYEARRLEGESFPGLVEAPGASTRGLLYLDVSDAAMARLDAYEGECYDRIAVPVQREDGAVVEAQVYLIGPGYRFMVLPERWSA